MVTTTKKSSRGASAKGPKTTVFTYEGLNRGGERVKGEIEGTSLALVKANLRKQGIQAKKVRKKPKPLFASEKSIKTQDITIFSRQMATMMAAGIPLIQSFDIVARGHNNPTMSKLILEIKNDIEGGSTFGEALSKHPKYFNDLFCNLVSAGESSGALETMLDRVATYMEKTESIKAKIKSALTYPIAVMCVAFLVTAAMMIFVVPQFEALFSGFGADLPAPTKFVIQMSEFFQKWWWLMFGGIGAAIWGIIYGKKTSKKFNYFWDRMMLNLPVVGFIIEKATIARFTRTLGITFAAGLPLVDALNSVSGATGNLIYMDATNKIRDDVSTGTQLQIAMRGVNLFPNMVIQMVAIGEESGSLEEMLSKVADFYEEEVDIAVDSLSSLLEPIILVFLAVIVGGLVISMYLPIFKMGSVV